MRWQTTLRAQNNPLHVDLFERFSQSHVTTETSSTVEHVEMAWNDKRNARKRLSDYAQPILKRPITRIHKPQNRHEF